MARPLFRLRPLATFGVLACLASAASAGYVTFGTGFSSKWDDPLHGMPAVITWGFVPDGTAMDPTFPLAPEVTGTSNVTALRNTVDGVYGAGAFDAALARAFHTWEIVAGVTFVGPVADPGLPLGAPTATTPDIRIAAFTAFVPSFFQGLGAVGYGPPGNDLYYPDPVAGDVVFNLSNTFRIFPGAEGAPFNDYGNDLEGLFLHELGHAAMGLGHPTAGVSEVMYVGAGCCTFINRVPSPDDITGARVVYGPSATPACQNGIDDDGDGLVDYPADPGCASAIDQVETNGAPACSDGIDNDGDGKTDFGPRSTNDPGCYDAAWYPENPACSDGIDNDGDTFVDLADPQCNGNAWQNHETPPPSCGLLGAEALVGLAAWSGVRSRRRVRFDPSARR